MTTFSIVCVIVAVVSSVGGSMCAIRLYNWEQILRRSRVSVHFKGKTAMTPRLIDLVTWTLKLKGDSEVRGQVIYKQGGTTITLRKPLPRDHGKTKRRTIKGNPHA